MGPLRVWPGGLAMSRTLGDYEVRLKSSTVVLAGLRLALVLAGISRCPVWLSQAFLWHARAYWGVISCFRPDAGISDVAAHLDSLSSMGLASCALFNAIQDRITSARSLHTQRCQTWLSSQYASMLLAAARQHHSDLPSVTTVCLQAGSVVLSEPEVRQVTLPFTGGRLIIASDGLWDAVHPKTAAHHVRGMPASKATSELVRQCSVVLHLACSPRLQH